MSLSHHDQLGLMQDILTNHLEDCCGTVSECEQLQRLVKSLLANEKVPEHLNSVFENIYSYSQNGKNSSDLDSHIESHQEILSDWVDQIRM